MSDNRRDPIEADDEITTDVDPDWIASIRAGIAEPADAGGADDEPGVGHCDGCGRLDQRRTSVGPGSDRGCIERIDRTDPPGDGRTAGTRAAGTNTTITDTCGSGCTRVGWAPPTTTAGRGGAGRATADRAAAGRATAKR